jgi:hypothetical protein
LDAARERWVASATIGYDGRGKWIVRRGRGRTKTEAKNKLRQPLRDLDDGAVVANDGYTGAQAVEDWLIHGLSNRDPATQEVNRRLCEKHVIPQLGAWTLHDLKGTEVDALLTRLSTRLSTRTLQTIRSCLNRSVKRAVGAGSSFCHSATGADTPYPATVHGSASPDDPPKPGPQEPQSRVSASESAGHERSECP